MNEKPLFWLGSSKKDLLAMAPLVQREFGYALHLAQSGQRHASVKTLKGFGSAAVVEVVEDFLSDTHRAVYTVRFENAIYVLHCFKKKSTSGAKTPKPDLDLIRERLKQAEKHAKGVIR